MKNKLGIIALISLGVFIIFGAIAGVGIANTIKQNGDMSFSISDDALEYTLFKEADLDGIDIINIDVISSDIRLIESSDGLTATLITRSLPSTKKLILNTTTNGNILDVQVIYPNANFSSLYSTLSVALPKDFTGEINVVTTSGNLDATLLNDLTQLYVKSISGNINLFANSVDKVKLQSTSGNFTINGDITNKLDINTTSGNTRINTITSDKAEVSIKSISGDIEVKYESACPTTIRSTSGQVRLDIPENAPILLDYSSTSGNLSGDANISSDGVLFKVNTVSGDLDFD